uniref:Uncharacterized protein n=1 Tax=Arundo donax TaxID=35708 RepID=A0A0A9AY98_ARUDO
MYPNMAFSSFVIKEGSMYVLLITHFYNLQRWKLAYAW